MILELIPVMGLYNSLLLNGYSVTEIERIMNRVSTTVKSS